MSYGRPARQVPQAPGPVPGGPRFPAPFNAAPGGPERHYVRKPTDVNLPNGVESVVPEAQLYKKLQELEKRLDATITRKRLDLQDTINRSLKKTKILRVFVSNTSADQAWQTGGGIEDNSFDFMDLGGIASWNLRIEGRLVDETAADDPKRAKFNSFFTSIIVELETADDADIAIENNIVEWHEPPPGTGQNVEFDVLDIRRKGDHNVNAHITLQLKEFPIKFKLSAQLARVLAIEEETETGVVLALWHYIRFHKLQDNDERRLIRCDNALKEIFGREAILFSQIRELVKPHLSPRDPIVIDYVVRVDKESTLGEAVFDIELEVDDPVRAEMVKMLETGFGDHSQILDIDNRIALAVQALNTSRLKREFFSHLSEDPVGFIDKWTASQSRDLSIITSDKGFNEEDVRRASFYTDELLSQSVHLFLNPR